jgi:ferritin-like metal-binding protein YciE
MQIGPERRPLRERLSENIEQMQQDQNASLLEAFQTSETNIERMLKSTGSTMSKDIRSSQEKLSATLERHLKSSEEQIHQLKIGMAENERLAVKNRLLKLSVVALMAAVLTFGGVLFLENHLRGSLIASAFNQSTYSEFPILIFDTKTGTYERCRDIDGRLSCQPTE